MSLRSQWRCGACAAVVLTAAACGGAGGVAPVRLVHVTERDFQIRAPLVLRAGAVHFVVRNTGPVSHELILVRAPHGRLPMRSDGLTVDEEALTPRVVGVLEPAGPGNSRDLRVRLVAGRYVLFCNMSGHYMSGMSASLLVR
jgi:uncharacterized cupredoxin-like copper-binding protein